METTFLVIFPLFLFFKANTASSSNNILITSFSNVTCIQKERQSLLVFRQGLTDESNRLSTWTGVECCEWQGVGCDILNGHVVKLDLRAPSPLLDYYNLNTRKWLEGKVSSSLRNLKYLRYLDLSMNNFTGQNIPDFLGFFKYLEYLNLSYSGFGGLVPPHLGNLSRLQYLDLNLLDRAHMVSIPYDVSLMVKDNLQWVSLLSSLKHLDLSGITIGNHIDWFNSVNMLPSLLTLNLASCDINIPTIKFINFTSLNSLDLYGNNINSTIPVWLSNLTSLVHLNLQKNNFHGRIPDFIGTLSSLSSIGLSLNQLSGPIPTSLGRLSSLRVLSLYSNQLSGSIPKSIGLLQRLQVLYLHSNQLSGDIPESIGLLTSLQVFSLYSNQLSGKIPASLGQLSNLITLDISYNSLVGVVNEIHFTKLNNLIFLSLSDNSLTLNVSPHWIPPFQLNYLDARSCKIGPRFPNWLQTQTNLTSLGLSNSGIRDTLTGWFENIISHIWYLDLSDNQISGNLPRIKNIPTRELLNLQYLYLDGNQLSGSIPESIGLLTRLKELSLYSNQLSGSIPESIGQLLMLETLFLANNLLSGKIPNCLGQLSNLISLDVTNNSLNGVVSEIHFTELNNLTFLSLSDNSLTLHISSHWTPPFQLIDLGASSCNIGPKFPNWLQKSRHLQWLELSNSGIKDRIPEWFQNISSHIWYLDLSDNHIGGYLPRINNSGIEFVNLRNNHFIGSVSTHLCELLSIKLLDLSNNNLSGVLPKCLGSLIQLQVMDLTNNNITGEVPNSLGSLSSLQSLHLHNNKFKGNLPVALQNLTSLVTFDFGNNFLTGNIPSWIGKKLMKLKILNLQSNKFTGKIPLELCQNNVLQHLNLANNIITGTIPHCFWNLTGMIMTSDSFVNNGTSMIMTRGKFVFIGNGYEENIVTYIKGIQLKYTKTIRFLISLDISSNKIIGEIPDVLMNLVELKNLNLSRNLLSGQISVTIGNLKHMESLDLSANKLSGRIPPSLDSLNFLSYLNLSFNNLNGRIPIGNQHQTLGDPSTIFRGNNELCGPSLLRSCKENKSLSYAHVGEDEGKDVSQGYSWFYFGMLSGFVVGFMGLIGSLRFIRIWRVTYFAMIQNVYAFIMIPIIMTLSRLRTKILY